MRSGRFNHSHVQVLPKRSWDEGHLEAFRIGAGALIEVGIQLQNFLSSISRIVRHDSLLEGSFKKDQKIFSNQFHTIYGVSP